MGRLYLYKKQILPIFKRKMKDYEKLLEISKQDLEASKTLYSKKFYPHSAFFLQQSIEKANKAFSIFINIAEDIKDAKKANHNPLNLAKNAAEKYEKENQYFEEELKDKPHLQDLFEDSKPHFENLKSGAKDMIETVNLMNKSKDKIFRVKEENIEKGIDTIYKNLDYLEQQEKELKEREPPKGFNIFLKSLFEEQVKSLGEKLSKKEYPPLDLEKVEGAKKEALKEIESGDFLRDHIKRQLFINKATQVFAGLNFLTGLTLAFESSSRYPEELNNWKLPSELYNEDLAIIKKINLLFELQGKLLKKFDDLISL